MLIKRLHLTDFRGFRSAQIELDPQLTVLVGVNGAGKTSVLDAIALMLDQYVVRLLASPRSARRLLDTDTRIGSPQAKVRLTVEHEDREFRWMLMKQGNRQRLLRPLGSDLGSLNDLVRDIASRGDDDHYLRGETLAVYYDQRRAVVDVPKRKRGAAKHEARDAFVEGRVPGGVDFRAFTYWFEERESEELRRQRKDPSYVDRQLDAVRRAIKTSTGFSDLTYRIEAPRGLCVHKRKLELHVEQLSAGERTFLALAGDLARRLALVSGPDNDPLLGQAVVMIDEVELHLHPGWQRAILPWMLGTFPNCQFIVSTHSPQVLGEVPAQHVRVLSPGKQGIEVKQVDASLGRDSNFLLLRVLGAGERNDKSKTALRRVDQLIEQGDLDGAKKQLRNLQRLIEGSPPEISVAKARIERRERGGS